MGGTSRDPIAAEPAKATRRGPTLRETRLEDYDQIASLEARHGLAAKSYEEWTHLHLSNPFRPQFQPGSPIGWVIEGEDQQIVGSVGNIPLLYEFEGSRIQAVTGRGLVVEPEYRSMSLLLLDRLINQPGADLFLTNAITPASALSFGAFECERVPAGEWDESAFWITHYQGFLASFLAAKKFPLAKMLSYPLSPLVFVKDCLTTKAKSGLDVDVRSCEGFDDRFDDFWEDLKRKNPHSLLAVRSREVLDWHFKYPLLNHRLWIATAVDGARLAGYAIFDRRDNPKIGLKRMRLVDFQSLDETAGLLWPMLSWAHRRCRDEGIQMLESVGGWLEKGDLIDTRASHRRKLSTWTYIYRANSPSLANSLRNRRAWSPTLFDASASL